MLATHHPALASLLSVADPVFPILPLSGVLALAQEQRWLPTAAGERQGSSRISYRQAREVWLQARQHSGHAMPLLSGQRKALPALSHLAAGMQAQATLGDAIRFGLEYQMIAGAMVRLSLHETGQQAEIRAVSLFEDAELEASLAADHLVTAVNAARQLVSGWNLQRVELCLQSGSAEALYRAFFGCEVWFGAPHNRVLIDACELQRQLAGPDPLAARLARSLCEQELQAYQLAPRSLRTTLTDLACETLSVQQMAGQLQISVRSLHRLLAGEGISYADLSEKIAMERARAWLADGKTTEQIAELLAYADSRSLRRAFKRQNGISPQQYRQSLDGANVSGNSNQKLVPRPAAVLKKI